MNVGEHCVHYFRRRSAVRCAARRSIRGLKSTAMFVSPLRGEQHSESRSDEVTLAVDFSPRKAQSRLPCVAERRLRTGIRQANN